MKFIKMIALSLAMLSLVTLVSCAKNVCDVCKKEPPAHSVNASKKVELCDFCYQKLIQTETDSDLETIKETAFENLTEKQKNYIVIFVEERTYYYAGIMGEPAGEQLDATVRAEAADRYGKTSDQIKAIVDAHKAKYAK